MNYYSLSDYLKATYGEKYYKLSLSAGCTCPNRDGTLGTGGCSFCSAGGSGDFATSSDLSLDEQFEEAKARVQNKTSSDRFIAYFQSYTGTYGDIDRLRALYTEAIHRPDVAILSIATRPDCLGPEVLELLAELAAVKPVWVELGLQTSNEKTARNIRRGYENTVYEKALQDLSALGIPVITHIILGLPGETADDMEASVRYACGCGTWGLKLQLLHVLEGTKLAEDYRAGNFEVLSMEEYLDILCRLLPVIPPDVVLHRLTGDGPKHILIAPQWSGNKRLVLNTMNRVFRERNIVQGSALNSSVTEPVLYFFDATDHDWPPEDVELSNMPEVYADRIRNAKAEEVRMQAFGSATLLREHLGVMSDDQLVRGEQGKLSLAGVGPYFCLSHSDPITVLAVSNEPVGVDIEQNRNHFESIVRRFLPEDWKAELEALPEKERQTRFTELWTCLEAAVKLDGRGLTIDRADFPEVLSQYNYKTEWHGNYAVTIATQKK